MPLADDIRRVADDTLAELIAAHDYFEDTKNAWLIVRQHVADGRPMSLRNVVTGTVTSPAEMEEKARRSVSRQLAEATLQQFLSVFESFLVDLLRLWLLAFPQSLSGKTVDFREILSAHDLESVKVSVVNRELDDLQYQRPKEWFEYLNRKVNLGCPTPDEIDRIAEAKASRDVLVHNRGIVNRLYESKAGSLARFRAGDRVEIPEPYHRETWELLRKVVVDISNAAIAKAT